MTLDNAQNMGKPLVKLAIVGYAVFALYLLLVVKVLLFKFGSFDSDLFISQWKLISKDPYVLVERLHDRSNLVPFHEIESYVRSIRSHNSWHSTVNFLGNVIAFVPLGFLLPLLFSKRAKSLFKVLLYSFMLSFAVELTQLVMDIGRFDVDDLLLNTAGGFIGYVMYGVFWLVWLRPLKKRVFFSATPSQPRQVT